MGHQAESSASCKIAERRRCRSLSLIVVFRWNMCLIRTHHERLVVGKIWLHISALSEVVFDFSDKINLNLERFTTTGQLEWRGLKSGQGQFFIHRPDALGLRHNFSIHNIDTRSMLLSAQKAHFGSPRRSEEQQYEIKSLM